MAPALLARGSGEEPGGERGVMMEDDEEENDDENYRMFSEEYGDTAMEDNEEEGPTGSSCAR